MTDDSRAVVLLSGGMDSATAAAEAADRGADLYCLHAGYGQETADREERCARLIAEAYDAADFLAVETDHLARIGASSLTDDAMAVPDADGDADAGGEGSSDDAVPSTYVPFRNANLLAMAVSYAEANDCGAVYLGVHDEDHAGYPDTRAEFVDAFQAVVDAGTKPETAIDVRAPFLEGAKADVVDRGLELGVPYADTWSCYRAEAPACGTCDACKYRLQAFRAAGARDPIEYAERPSGKVE